jgi:membrane protease YdiL (CAAX protease family)
MEGDQHTTITKRNVLIFTAVALLCGWAGLLLNHALDIPHEDSPGMLLWLIAPLITVLCLRAFAGDGWRDAGFKPLLKGNVKWYVISLLVFPVLTLTCVFTGYALGWITLNGFDVSVFLHAFAIALIPNFFKNIPEEFVWRGYLTPKLASLNLGDFSLYALVGLIWGVWHVPYYIYFLDSEVMSDFTSLHLGLFIPLSVLITIAWSVVFVELWLLSKSIWPAVLMHMVEDAFVNPLVLDGSFQIAEGMDLLIHPVVGIFSIVLYSTIGLLLRRHRLKQEAASF